MADLSDTSSSAGSRRKLEMEPGLSDSGISSSGSYQSNDDEDVTKDATADTTQEHPIEKLVIQQNVTTKTVVKKTMGDNHVKKLAQVVEKAVRQRKIFCLGPYFHSAKRALRKRGWIELTCQGSAKCSNRRFTHNRNFIFNTSGAISDVSDFNLHRLYENVEATQKFVALAIFTVDDIRSRKDILLRRLTRNFVPNYLWCTQRSRIPWKDLKRDQTVNKFPTVPFASKIGLHQCLQEAHWFSQFPVSSFFPRCFLMTQDDERSAFIEEYQITACVCVVKWFYKNYKKFGSVGTECRTGPARRTVLDFAIQRCRDLIGKYQHKDVDGEVTQVYNNQWELFLADFYLLCHQNAKMKYGRTKNGSTPSMYYRDCEDILYALRKCVPHMISMDGQLNMWIIKPGSSSRGRGILLGNRLENILKIVDSGNRRRRYVLQKYIERPMLIFETKFDIRQWFLVTSWNPLVIWMYKECYLRFCSQKYNTKSLHESVHLCNNAIQAKYTNGMRSNCLPDENMWDNATFDSYLKNQGHGEKWQNVIVPAMKRALISTMLATQDMMEMRQKYFAFELFGADFMLTEDLNPWLIEINSCPALGATTSVTARMCAEMLEDVIRVTTDRRRNKMADTGNFELVFKQPLIQNPIYLGINLAVHGTKIDASKLGVSGQLSDDAPDSKTWKPPLTSGPPVKEKLSIMTDLIDSIMSIPSSLQDTKSKIALVKDWIKKAKDYEEGNIDYADEDTENNSEVDDDYDDNDSVLCGFDCLEQVDKSEDDDLIVETIEVADETCLSDNDTTTPTLTSDDMIELGQLTYPRERKRKGRRKKKLKLTAWKYIKIRKLSGKVRGKRKGSFARAGNCVSTSDAVLLQDIPFTTSHRILHKYGCFHNSAAC